MARTDHMDIEIKTNAHTYINTTYIPKGHDSMWHWEVASGGESGHRESSLVVSGSPQNTLRLRTPLPQVTEHWQLYKRKGVLTKPSNCNMSNTRSTE